MHMQVHNITYVFMLDELYKKGECAAALIASILPHAATFEWVAGAATSRTK
jgi:hypothetical protein